MTDTDSTAAVRRALREVAVMCNIDPTIMEAIGYVESKWKLSAVNTSGPDGARGGAYGPTQITERTARAHGYVGPMMELARRPVLAATWTAKILAARPGGPPETLGNVAAWWNAGRVSMDKVPLKSTARTAYLPRLIAAYDKLKSGKL